MLLAHAHYKLDDFLLTMNTVSYVALPRILKKVFIFYGCLLMTRLLMKNDTALACGKNIFMLCTLATCITGSPAKRLCPFTLATINCMLKKVHGGKGRGKMRQNDLRVDIIGTQSDIECLSRGRR